MGVEGHERYINPYTDFGFKKLFGTELNKDLLISFLNALFEQAEIAGFTPQERKEYQESVKDYWDYYSTVKTAHKKGIEEGRVEANIENARRMKADNMPVDLIAKYTGLTQEEIATL